jgi:hypothetical protein
VNLWRCINRREDTAYERSLLLFLTDLYLRGGLFEGKASSQKAVRPANERIEACT